MILEIASLVFLFIIRLRFPGNNSIMQTFRKQYDKGVVKLVRDLEKLDFETRKRRLNLDFVNLSIINKVIPEFIQFRLANKDLWNSVVYRKCLNRLLQQEIVNKKRRYRLLEKDVKPVK